MSTPEQIFRHDGIYGRRFQLHYPWGLTRWGLHQPLIDHGGDEWCNDSIMLKAPLLGMLVIFWRPGSLRTVPCADEWSVMAEDERADYAPCGRLYNGRWHEGGHVHWETGVCVDAKRWLNERI
jgi:hypothetical protein